MSNAANNIKDVGSVVAKLAATMFADNCQFIKSIDKEPESSFNSQVNGFNVGQTINISKPARFIPTTNADITSSLQDIVEEKIPLTLNIREVQAVSMTSLEIQNQLALKDWAKRVLKPAMSSLSQTVESTVLSTAKNAIFNSVGTAGSTVFDTDTVLSAREKLNKFLAPQGDRMLLLDPTAERSAVNARKGLFQSTSAIAEQYREGYIGRADGFEYMSNNLLPTHTRGTQTGSFTVTTTVSVEGQATLALTGTSGGTLKAGDIFTIANVFAVHPITKVKQTFLQQFVVTADNTAVSTAYSGVPISPAIYTSASNGLQNVDSFPQSSAAVTIVGAASTGYTQNFAYHPSAFRFVSVPLMKPNGTHMVGQETVDGITIRVWMDSVILTDKMVMRLDFLGGFAAVRPEWACRLTA